MKYLRSVILSLLLVVLFCLGAAAAADIDDEAVLSKLEKKCLPAAVIVESSCSQGSGFFISPDGFLLTNRHVVDVECKDFRVTIPDTGETYPAKLVQWGKEDYALLKVDKNVKNYMTLGDSKFLKEGDGLFMLVCDSSEGEDDDDVSLYTLTGTVNDTECDVDLGNVKFIECKTDKVVAGNSGSMAANIDGEVVGIVTGCNASDESLGYILPIENVYPLLNKYGVNYKHIAKDTNQYEFVPGVIEDDEEKEEFWENFLMWFLVAGVGAVVLIGIAVAILVAIIVAVIFWWRRRRK